MVNKHVIVLKVLLPEMLACSPQFLYSFKSDVPAQWCEGVLVYFVGVRKEWWGIVDVADGK